MKKLNAKGFSPLELILLVLIIGALGGVGYYVYNAQKKTTQTFSNTSKAAGEAQKSEKKQLSTETKPTKSEIATATEHSYVYGSHKLYYTPPAGWKLEEFAVEYHQADKLNMAYANGYIKLASPDYKDITAEGQECHTFTGKTVFINLSSTTDSNETTLQGILNPSSSRAFFYKNQRTAKFAGQSAVQAQHSPGECGYSTTTETVNNGFDIAASASSDDGVTTFPYLKSPYAAIYNAFVASIRFE